MYMYKHDKETLRQRERGRHCDCGNDVARKQFI